MRMIVILFVIMILFVIGMLVIMEAARLMIVTGFFTGVAVQKAMGVAVFMLMDMLVDGSVVQVGMGISGE